MARLRFRVTTISFDEEEDVSAITAVVRDDTYQVIKDLIGEVETTSVARGETEYTIVLPAADVVKLFGEVGQISHLDQRHAALGSDVYNSLSWVVYRLMDDD